jgi:hypothetical protein
LPIARGGISITLKNQVAGKAEGAHDLAVGRVTLKSPHVTLAFITAQDEEEGELVAGRSAAHSDLADRCSIQGSAYGRVRQWQDIHALHDLVRHHHLAFAVHVAHANTHSSNNPASLTSRLGVTIDVEQNHVRFLGDLTLNLWDCGGQDGFMDSYLSTQRSTIFSHVGVLIYVFDIVTLTKDSDTERKSREKDLEYYRDCLDALAKYSPEASVFLLIHKMDLVRLDRMKTFDKQKAVLLGQKGEQQKIDFNVQVFGTTIHDESLYRVCSDDFFPYDKS